MKKLLLNVLHNVFRVAGRLDPNSGHPGHSCNRSRDNCPLDLARLIVNERPSSTSFLVARLTDEDTLS